jgi:hypothetical protein
VGIEEYFLKEFDRNNLHSNFRETACISDNQSTKFLVNSCVDSQFAALRAQVAVIGKFVSFLANSPLSFVGCFFLVFYFQENYARWRKMQVI